MAKRQRILVVDDQISIVRLVKGVLEHQGYEILTAYDGEEGLAVAQKEKPDLIILDILMPRLDGYAVCRILQQDQQTASIPIIMLTVKGQLDEASEDKDSQTSYARRIGERMEAFEAGAIEFLTKPIRSGELVERVRGLLWLDAKE